jgi:hypothetical protein
VPGEVGDAEPLREIGKAMVRRCFRLYFEMRVFGQHLVLISVFLFINSCITTGKNFSLEKKNNRKLFLIGKTTKHQVFEELGTPETESLQTKHGLTTETFSWFFTVNTGPTHQRRSLYVEFKDNKVNAYSFTSSFAGDSTEFNEEVAKDIKKGATPKVIADSLGYPTGEVNVPSNFLSEDLVPRADYQGISRIWIYAYYEIKAVPFQHPDDAYSYAFFFFNESKQVERIIFQKKR